MTLLIRYESRSFPASYSFGSGKFKTSWNELLWAAITIGRPSTYVVFRYGPPSFHEAIFRLSLIRMAVEQNWNDHLQRTDAFVALDPTEKGMVSYFLGMALCKLFASRLLYAPWLLHLDVFRPWLNLRTLGRSRPDLIGQDNAGKWHAFESKGRSSEPSWTDKAKAKSQANRLVSVNGKKCALNVASFAFFKSELLQFYWQDPEPTEREAIALPDPNEEWRYYYEPALSLASVPESDVLRPEREMADVIVEIHPEIRHFLDEARWSQAREVAGLLRETFLLEGYQPDGLRVTAGETWSRPFESLERG
jgi:hypothetical protein